MKNALMCCRSSMGCLPRTCGHGLALGHMTMILQHTFC